MTEERQIQFEKYLSDQLNAEERSAFEQRLKDDVSFKEEYDLFVSMQQFLDTQIEHGDALASLRKVSNQQRQENTGAKVIDIKRNRRRAFMMAASIAFLISFGGYFVMQEFTQVEPPTFAELYQEPIWPIQRGNEIDSIAESMQLYFNNKQVIAKTNLKTINTPRSNYWLSEIYLKESKTDSVLIHLPAPNQLPNHHDRILYISILANWSIGNMTEVKNLLNELPTNSDYKKTLNQLIF